MRGLTPPCGHGQYLHGSTSVWRCHRSIYPKQEIGVRSTLGSQASAEAKGQSPQLPISPRQPTGRRVFEWALDVVLGGCDPGRSRAEEGGRGNRSSPLTRAEMVDSAWGPGGAGALPVLREEWYGRRAGCAARSMSGTDGVAVRQGSTLSRATRLRLPCPASVCSVCGLRRSSLLWAHESR